MSHFNGNQRNTLVGGEKLKLYMSVLEELYCVCRLGLTEDIKWAQGEFVSITKTADECSVVCPKSCVPEGIKYEGLWRILKVQGPLDFELIGILSFISRTLADAGISIFAISTYDTDYILVKSEKIDEAKKYLQNAGISF